MAPDDVLGLRGRTVIITGAGRGVGRAHALALGELGVTVIVNDLDSPDMASGRTPAQEVVADIEAAGGAAFAVDLDVSNWAACADLVALAVKETGRLDGVLNNAGIVHQSAIVDLDQKTFDHVMDVHLGSTIGCTVAALKHWRDHSPVSSGGASIVNTISESMFVAQPGLSPYMVAKSAIAELTLVTSREARAYGVRANAYGPRVRTRMSPDAKEGLGEERDGTVRDPANAAPLPAWLLSPQSAHVTGQLFYMVGGAIGRVAAWPTEPVIWPYEGHRFGYDEVGPAINSHIFGSRFPERALIDPFDPDAGFRALRTRDVKPPREQGRGIQAP